MNIPSDLSRAMPLASVPEVIDDASRLNPTPVFRHWIVSADQDALFIAKVREELKQAAAARRSFVAAGARHSMGGQSIPRNGTALTMNSHRSHLNPAAGTYTVNAGTRWHQVIDTLDDAGFSPVVMQSNNDFSVAGSCSVSAHGWPAPYGPVGSTVRSFRLMLADGTIVSCSRQENRELFSLVIGGYGLFGVILDLELVMIPNCGLEMQHEVMESGAFGARFKSAVNEDPSMRMAYGRLNIARHNFLGEGIMVTYRSTPKLHGSQTALARYGQRILSSATRSVFRAQTGSELGKWTRWLAETVAAPFLLPSRTTRNAVLNQSLALLSGGDPTRTDILHEYFVPPERFGDFIAACQDIIPQFHQDCLNITLRFVGADHESVLSYAPAPRIAAVIAFSQQMTPAADVEMLLMTEALIDRVLAIGGSFYLPYRLHARRDQIEAAYGNVKYFINRKFHYDPGQLFCNALWETYFV